MLGALGLAEGEELGSNLTLADFARFRPGSLPEGVNTLRPTGRAPWPGDLRQLSGCSRHPVACYPQLFVALLSHLRELATSADIVGRPPRGRDFQRQ
jgi:hypothetical protein